METQCIFLTGKWLQDIVSLVSKVSHSPVFCAVKDCGQHLLEGLHEVGFFPPHKIK